MGAQTLLGSHIPVNDRYVEEPRALIHGNAVRLLRNGVEAFPAWLAAIEAARHRISMEMYIFEDDRIGAQFADALARAAERGVVVRLLYDFVGCRNTSPGFFTRLRERGVHTIVYHAYRFWRPRFWALFRRNHRKTLVCDGKVAFTGGLNIADHWVGQAEGGGDWRDAAVEIEGPAVALVEAPFVRTWNRRARKRFRLRPQDLVPPPPAGDSSVAVISNSELLDRFAIRRAALHAIRESRRRIYLANPYFIPDRGILRALQQAARRGVDVRILVPERSDVRFLDYAARATFAPLLAAGVRIWQHAGVMHAKALMVDGELLSIGSYNLDHRSLVYNLELVVNALDRTAAGRFAQMMDDESQTGEIRQHDFERRTLFMRFLERLAYRLRYWL